MLAVGRELGGDVCVPRSSTHCVGAGLQGEQLISPSRRLSRETDACRHPRVSRKPESCGWSLLGVTSPGSRGEAGEVGETSLGNRAPGCLGRLGVIRRKEEGPTETISGL